MAADGKAVGLASPAAGRGSARRWYHPLPILSTIVDQWFLVGIAVVIVLAWRFPHVGMEHGSELGRVELVT